MKECLDKGKKNIQGFLKEDVWHFGKRTAKKKLASVGIKAKSRDKQLLQISINQK